MFTELGKWERATLRLSGWVVKWLSVPVLVAWLLILLLLLVPAVVVLVVMLVGVKA